MSALRKNVASQVFTFALINASTGAALTGATASGKVSIDGGAQASCAGAFTELGQGQYKYAPTQGETNGTSIGFILTATSAIPVNLQFFTTANDPTNATTGGLGNLDAAVSAVKTQTDKLTFTVANQIDANVLDWKSSTAPAMTGDAYARLGAPAGASVSADIAAVNAKTTNLPGSPAATGDAMALTTGERNSVADAILNRDMSLGTDSGSTTVRTIRQALRFLRNKWTISAGTLSVFKEDDTTVSWTGSVTTDGTASPVVGNDPAG